MTCVYEYCYSKHYLHSLDIQGKVQEINPAQGRILFVFWQAE
jgi:hypothetical protein